jgi:hypothetical protein
VRANYLFWGLWLVTVAVVFSKIRIPHTAYMASLAPPLAALAAAGLVHAWRGLRDRTAAWLLPALVVAEVAWTLYLYAQFAQFPPWLPWVVLAAALAALPVLIAAAVPRGPSPRRAVLSAAMVLAAAAMVLAPSAWAASVLNSRYGGSAFDASAGPASMEGPGGAAGGPGQTVNAGRRGGPAAGPMGGPFGDVTNTLTAGQRRTYEYLAAHRGGAQFLAATSSWRTAGPYIMTTGAAILPMGGFSGTVPNPTLAAAQGMVDRGELHYFLLAGEGGGVGPGGVGRDSADRGAAGEIADWARSTCAPVPAEEFGGDGEELYRC